MKVKLTVDIFSGRPNPTITLEGKEAKKLLADLKPAEKFQANSDATIPEPFQLGYRGIVIEQLDEVATDMPAVIRVTPDRLYAADSSAATKDTEFEKNIFDRLTKMKNVGSKKEFRSFLDEQVSRFKLERSVATTFDPSILAQIAVVNSCKCGPPHEVAWWNTPGIQPFNNCYNLRF